MLEESSGTVQGQPIAKPDVQDLSVTVPLGVGDVHVRIVKPVNAVGLLPVILYLHGGGWVMGNSASHDRLVCELAATVEAAVAFVEYALAPEAKYATQIEQAYGAAQWLIQKGAQAGLDSTRMAVAGDSAGGNMATVVATMGKQRVDVEFVHQSLFYPITDAAMNTGTYRKFNDGPYMREAMMSWFWDNYLPKAGLGTELTVSPLRASREQLRGLPPALVIVDENDVLRDEGEAYAARLRQVGVPTASARYNGIIHDFMMLNALRGTASARGAINQAVSALPHPLGTNAT